VPTGKRLGAPAPPTAPRPPDVSLRHPKAPRVARVSNLRPRLCAEPAQLPVVAPQQTERVRGRALQDIRRRHFRRYPLCVACRREGRVTAATQVDHERPLWDGGEDAESNRQGLCDDCHAAKTAVEAALRGKAR
jgi:5-methylcytosine-specific restriction protein A